MDGPHQPDREGGEGGVAVRGAVRKRAQIEVSGGAKPCGCRRIGCGGWRDESTIAWVEQVEVAKLETGTNDVAVGGEDGSNEDCGMGCIGS